MTLSNVVDPLGNIYAAGVMPDASKAPYAALAMADPVTRNAVEVGIANPVPGIGYLAFPSANFNRTNNTTTYSVGGMILQSASAGSCTPMTLAVARANDAPFSIRRLRLKVNDTTWLNAIIRVHLYKDLPTLANGDNGAWISGTTESAYLGYSDILMDRQFSDPFVKGIGVPAIGNEFNGPPSSGTQNIFAILETRSVIIPVASKTFTLVAEVLQN